MTGPGGAPADALERALLAHEAGNVAAAIGVCQAILDREPRHAGALNLLGVIEAQHGRFAEALRLLDASIEAEPMADAVHWNRGNVLGALGDLAAAATSYRRALVIHPAYAAALYGRATLHLAAGEIASGAVCLGRALASRPDYPEALFALGNVLQALGFTEAALRSYEGVLRLWPSHPGTLTNRASVLLSIGAIGAARASLIEALAVRPDLAEAWCNLGHALVEAKGLTAALRALDRALAIAPNYLMALTNRGNALSELARPDEALSSYDLALAFQPDNILALYNRGNVLWWRKRHRASRVSFERALALDPRHVSAWSSRGGLMLEVKRLGEARSSFARMRAIARDHAQSHATQIFALDFFPELGFPDHQKARRDWFRMHAERHAPEVSRHANTPDPSRRLVVGYVSGDFRAHSAAELFGPVLRRHDRNRFEMVCYSNAALSDRMTAEFQALADRWRPVVGFSDDQVAEAVRADRIDILVDLSGHSAGNRLLVFARKPAPVQVTAWGQASGTGMPMVDYLFGDPVTVPASARPLFAEKIWDLPSLIPYEAPAYAPAIEPGPGGRGEAVTFGCFNRFNKVSADALALWAGIVAAVPGARLLLKDSAVDDPEMRALVLDIMSGRGVAADRVEFRGVTSHQEHLRAYNDVDVVLDPFPNNGGLSTWEALWMGRPVVAMLGYSVGCRVSAGILTAIGLTETIAETDESYRDAAVTLANRNVLGTIRQGLRSRILASDAGNPKVYTQRVEQAYRAMWMQWCASDARSGG